MAQYHGYGYTFVSIPGAAGTNSKFCRYTLYISQIRVERVLTACIVLCILTSRLFRHADAIHPQHEITQTHPPPTNTQTHSLVHNNAKLRHKTKIQTRTSINCICASEGLRTRQIREDPRLTGVAAVHLPPPSVRRVAAFRLLHQQPEASPR